MLRELGKVDLKSGGRMRIICISGAQPEWAERLLSFLHHKRETTREPLALSLAEGIEPGVISFYVGLVGEELVGNTTTWTGAGGQAGILGHVFTPPEHRRKGICSHLMQATMSDFAAGGGRTMSLGTGYDGAPYWIYHSFGFRGMHDTGHMLWRAEEDFESRWFAPGETELRETHFGDWAALDALFSVEEGWLYRTVYYSQVGFGDYESAYWGWRSAILSGRIRQHRILAKPDGAVMGQAYLWPDHRFLGGYRLGSDQAPFILDLFVHPNFYDQLNRIVGAFDFTGYRKVQAYADSAAVEKVAVLERAGFVVEGRLKAQLQFRGRVLDMVVLGRS
jgi:hypothetical protein